MKKLLRRLIIFIVIVCAYLLIKEKTTRLGTTIQTGDIAPATGVVITGIDLTNCVSYFDGCNNCSVKDGKADACTLMYCETPSEPKCLQYATGSEVKNIDLSNCITYFDGCNTCLVQDDKLSICTTNFCAVDAMEDPKCIQPTLKAPSTGTARSITSVSMYCVKNGGTIMIEEGTGGQIGICSFPDGRTCEEGMYMRNEGQCWNQ